MNKKFINVDYNNNKSLKQVLNTLKKFNQEQIIEHINNLADEEKLLILKSFNRFDIDNYFQNIVNKYFNKKNEEKNIRLDPISIINHIDDSSSKHKELKSIGEESLKNGEVAFLVVAGGQGTRLGFNHPKGLFPIAPITNKTLFNIHFEKILAASKYYNFTPTFLIMTSDSNYKETLEYINTNNYFGIDKDNVFIFKQGSLPAIDFNCKLILNTKLELFFAPDGHGGTIQALKLNGLIDIMLNRGIKYISYFQVDNPLINIADPVFIGLHIKEQSEVSTKVIKKRNWKEKVGVAGKINGKPGIIEYSDLPETLAKQTDEDGNLIYGYGNIAIHIFNIAFIKKITEGKLSLPFHIAKKKIPFFDKSTGKTVVPDTPNGIKFEQFIFDTIPLAENAIFYETLRELEFAPLKNKEGEDSITTCRKGISDFFLNWFFKAGYFNNRLQISYINNNSNTNNSSNSNNDINRNSNSNSNNNNYNNNINYNSNSYSNYSSNNNEFNNIKDKFTLEISPLFALNFDQFNSRIRDFIKEVPYKLYIE